MPTFIASFLLLLVISPSAHCQDILIDEGLEFGLESDENSVYHTDDIVRFSKRINSVLKTNPTKDAANLAVEFKKEFRNINVDGTMGSMLGALYDMRLEDLLISVERVRKMKALLETLDS